MKSSEVDVFTSRFGYKPTAVRVAIDGLALYVHKDNPVKGMHIAQVDAIFSTSRKCGMEQELTNWSSFTSAGALPNQPIRLYGRDNKSGTHAYFAKKALCKGDFKDAVNAVPDSEILVANVASNPNAIGYSGIGYKTPSVRLVPLARKAGKPFVEATTDNIADGSYPLARFLYIYVNKKPGEPLAELEKTFIEFVLSHEGQQIVVSEGFVALPEKIKASGIKVIN